MADIVQTGTDFPFPPDPSMSDIAFKACCSRIFVVMPGMIRRRAWRDPGGSGHRPDKAMRSPDNRCGTASFELRPASTVISTILLHVYGQMLCFRWAHADMDQHLA